MSITKYTNIDDINNKSSNEGQYLQNNDLFIISKSEIEQSDFGNGKYDVMEVSIYDINNNLLPQNTLNNIAYIKGNDIKNYMYQIVNKSGLSELAINVEKLLKDLGYSNGILKVNINFVRNKVGSDNELEKVWIQEISPSREEIRILPLKTKFEAISNKNKKEFENLQNLNKEFKHYKSEILNKLNSFDNVFLTKIDTYFETKFGKDFFAIVKKDFGLSNFSNFRNKIFEDFKNSITYYLSNKYYTIGESNFGKASALRFEDSEIYDIEMMFSEMQSILNNCIDFNIKNLKRRTTEINQLPKEFAIEELRKQIQNNIEAFSTFSEVKRNVFVPDKVNVSFQSKVESTPIIKTPDVIIPPIADTPISNPNTGGGGSLPIFDDGGLPIRNNELGRVENFR